MSDAVKRAVIVVCDGLRADMVTPELTPNLARLAGGSTVFADHRGVFPSTTRVTAACIATGCLPGRHGLEGNVVALDEGKGLVAVSAGPPGFRDRMAAARGRTLLVPTLAERLKDHGGAIAFANASAGAAQFLDPDGHGHVYHRQISYGPGRRPPPEGEALNVSHDAAGDAAMTDRFLAEVLGHRRPALAVLWLCEPDHSQHGHPMGSPAHLAAVAAADACAGRVAAALQDEGDEVLLVLCSDHGHETVASVISLETLMIECGLKGGPGSHDLVVASNGTSAAIYLSEIARQRLGEVAAVLRAQPWIGKLYAGDELAAVGLPTDTALAIALTGRGSDGPNPHGVPGLCPVFADPLSDDTHLGCGQHGGLGPYEQRPFLMVCGGGYGRGSGGGTTVKAHSSPIDIAPTVLRHLGQAGEGMDGKTLNQT